MSQYWNIELSFPEFERDCLRFLTFGCDALGGNRGNVALFVPPDHQKIENLPLVVLLHGVYGSHWSWALNGRAHLTAREMIDAGRIRPLVLAMPCDGLRGQGSGYLPLADVNCEAWIVDAVVSCVTDVLSCVSPMSRRFIAGLSMGGYGALRLGAKYASRFQGVSGHSSITHYDQLAEFVEQLPETADGLESAELDVGHWMIQRQGQLPPVRFDCGEDDRLVQHNRALHRRLTEAGIAHQYVEHSGAHSWEYWQTHLRDTLEFFDGI